jgi:pimeloyl-ACP methyl ester carboxylesterase
MPFIQVDNVVHYYTIEGAVDAPVLVFANSLGSDNRIWDPILPHLREKYKIIRYIFPVSSSPRYFPVH